MKKHKCYYCNEMYDVKQMRVVQVKDEKTTKVINKPCCVDCLKKGRV